MNPKKMNPKKMPAAKSLSEIRSEMLGVNNAFSGITKLVLLNRGQAPDGLHAALIGGIVVSKESFGFKDGKTELWECEIVLIPKRKFRDEDGIHRGTLDSILVAAMTSGTPNFNDGMPYEKDGKPTT